MGDWLLEHQTAVQFDLCLAAFGVVALWESFRPVRTLRTSTAVRWSRNMALAALDALVARFCLPASAVAVAAWAEQHGWGLLNVFAVPSGLSHATGIAAMDLANYGAHRLCHSVPLLWRCHKIHHSDLDFDCSTAFRHHPIEHFVVAGFMLALIVLIGAPPLAVLIAATLDLAVAVFNHGNVAIPARVDRMLRSLVVTPDMHRIHHSVLQAEGNRNFANVFPWWDRVFSTYRAEPELDHTRMELGIAEARAPEDVTLPKLLVLPFRPGPVVASA